MIMEHNGTKITILLMLEELFTALIRTLEKYLNSKQKCIFKQNRISSFNKRRVPRVTLHFFLFQKAIPITKV